MPALNRTLGKQHARPARIIAFLHLRSGCASRMEKTMINQDELDALVRDHEDMCRRSLNIKLRLNAGEKAVPGYWQAKAEKPDPKWDLMFETGGLSLMGLEVKRKTKTSKR